MTMHRQQSDLENADMTSTVKAFKTPEGLMHGGGKTVPADATAGWAPGALFVHTDGAAGTFTYVNEGSVTSSDFNAMAAMTASQEALLGGVIGTATASVAALLGTDKGLAAMGPMTWTDAAVQRAIDIQITPTTADRQLYMDIDYAANSKEAAYIIATSAKTTGETIAVRARAQAAAAGAATGEVRGVYGQGIANAALFAGTVTGVFGNAIAKGTSTCVSLRGGFFEAESEATPTEIANILGIHVRCKSTVAVTTDFLLGLFETEKMGGGVALDSFLAFKTTTWGAGDTVATNVIDMSRLVGTVTSIINAGAVTATQFLEVDADGDGGIAANTATMTLAPTSFHLAVKIGAAAGYIPIFDNNSWT